ncbi:MAG: hemerythrin domain-containing protein [Rhodocyclaceae bacterium]|nr:hemerythrin domain-containing protein [Rhodocyclaceae bacterium]
MTVVSRAMANDHGRCDALFADAEAAAEAAQWPLCQILTRNFCDAVLRHFSIEEDVIFPAFEARTGMRAGPTQVMRSEHAQMRELFDALSAASQTEDADAFADAAETLLLLMQQHNMKEENILYPMCDQAIGDDPAVAVAVDAVAAGEGA